MHAMNLLELNAAIDCLHQGGIIAYPTEAVYGLGCDPLNAQAVTQLLALKERHVSKGLILIAAEIEQLFDYIQPVSDTHFAKARSTWPGPVTWLFPVGPKTPTWICGEHKTVAVRVIAHPIASALCRSFGRPLVSTSANRQGQHPARTAIEAQRIFSDSVMIITGEVGNLEKPTAIYDVMTGEKLRQ